MPLMLTNRPPMPGMPTPGKTVNIHNKVRHQAHLNCPREIREQIDIDLTRIDALLRSFASIPITGTLKIIVVPDQTISFDGVLTAYWSPTDQQHNALIRQVDEAVTRLKYSYLPWLERVEFVMEQTILFKSHE